MSLQQTQKQWETEFDRHVKEIKQEHPEEGEDSSIHYFGYKVCENSSWWTIPDWGHIKGFIHNAVTSSRTEVIKEIMRKIKRLYASEAKDVDDQDYEYNYCRFRNEALDDVKTLLEKEIHE